MRMRVIKATLNMESEYVKLFTFLQHVAKHMVNKSHDER